MSLYEKTWQVVRDRVATAAALAGRDPTSIRLLAVSKGFPPEAVREAYASGQRAFGENYVQEALAKIEALGDLPGIAWHLIGPLQSNKARPAAQRFAWVETVDRFKIAERLSAMCDGRLAPLSICIQVNISGEDNKSGTSPDSALSVARDVARLPGLALRGFMGIAETTADEPRQRAQFQILRELFEAARADALPVDTLSMGMSADLEAAVAEGATELRIGSALFGPRETGVK